MDTDGATGKAIM